MASRWTALATPGQIRGTRPLHQQQACVIKLHGDYLESSFLKTVDEVGSYARVTNKLLDQVFDQYGLIVAGWSSAWDPALRAALERCPARRYGCYWVEPYALSSEAIALRDTRDARVVKETAQQFFPRLAQTIGVLSEHRTHPVTVSVAVGRAKRYLTQGEQIQLHDMLAAESRHSSEYRWRQHRRGIEKPSSESWKQSTPH